jgi:hypothetical protein
VSGGGGDCDDDHGGGDCDDDHDDGNVDGDDDHDGEHILIFLLLLIFHRCQ